MKRMAPAAAIITLTLLLACSKENKQVDQTGIQPMLGAVMHSDTDEVRRLAERGIGLDERSRANQATPIIVASGSDQWPVIEILVDHGADIWAHDEFGVTAAQNAVTSRILRGSPEDAARLRVVEKLKARGYPFPPPDPDQVLALEKRGEWPPHGVRR